MQNDQPRVMALDIPPLDNFDDDIDAYFAKCREKLGLIPNVLSAYSFDQEKLRAFMALYNDLMLADSGLSKLEREMIAVVVSAVNSCFYCLSAHGASVRQLSGDPVLGEQMVMNGLLQYVEPDGVRRRHAAERRLSRHGAVTHWSTPCAQALEEADACNRGRWRGRRLSMGALSAAPGL